jgi:pyruvate dehydrogenase E2 component (dihydrolipoamide acetyltransferase)
MPVISVRIPQLGEGLQEALLVSFIKQPGEFVKRDEPIYVMETDKATTDVESPYEGTLIEWTVEAGSVLEIGTEIARMQVADGVKEMPIGHGPAETIAAPSRSAVATATAPTKSVKVVARGNRIQIPPKTRKYLKDHGLLDVADSIPAAGSKLMPEDIDAYLAAHKSTSELGDFSVVNLPQSQITLNFRLVRGTQVCVPVTVMNEIDWSRLEACRQTVRESGGPTAFSMALWCVVRALSKHDKFRAVLSADGRQLKIFHRVNLGIAVALPGDEMVTAVVANADMLNQSEFYSAVNRQVELARNGRDQANESTTITVSNIGKAGMRIGIPAIVAPAVATLAIGESYMTPVAESESVRFRPSVMATLSFDHRIVNGVGAANFLNDVKVEIERFSLA